VIIVSTSVWTERVWTNKQQIASRLANRGFDVLYVEPPRPFVSIWFKERRWCSEPVEITPNLKMLPSLPALPFPHRFPPSDLWNFKSVAKKLRNFAATSGFSPFVLWIYTPLAWPLLGRSKEAISCYDCVDDYAAFPGAWPKVIGYYERKLLQSVDLVFASSKPLFESKRKFHSDVHYVPNVADYELFKRAREPDLLLPEELSDLSHPILGFVGTFNYKLDGAILEHLAKRGYSIAVVGPIVRDTKFLERYDAVRFVGKKEPSELPAYLKAFDVCLIPYVIDRYTESVLPLKLFEYFASGKPVVATPFGEMKDYAHLVELASTPEQFEQAVKRVLSEPTERAAARIKEAKKHTWDVRIDAMLNLLTEKLEAKGGGA